MNKKSFLFLIVIFLFTTVKLEAQSNNVSMMVKAEASKKALTFLSLIPEGREKNYGFNSRSDFSKIKIEEPYQTYYVSDKNNILSFIAGNEWRVPLSVDGHYVTLLTVQMNKGNAEVVDLGGVILAQKLQEFEKQYPEVKSNPVIIRNTFLTQDFLTLHFSKLYNAQSNGVYLPINKSATDPLYQLNEDAPIRTSVASFCNYTLKAIEEQHLNSNN